MRRGSAKRAAVWALGLALAGCPNGAVEPQGPGLPVAKPLPAPRFAIVPSREVRDIALTPTATWVSTEGFLFSYPRQGGEPRRYGPAEGLELGEASRLVARGDEVYIAGARQVYLVQGETLRVLRAPEMPSGVGQILDIAPGAPGEAYALVAPGRSPGREALCRDAAPPPAALFRLTAERVELVETPGPAEQIATSPEGLWVASEGKLFLKPPKETGFRTLELGDRVEVGRLWVDPKGRIWALSNRGLFGGSAKAGVSPIPGGEFFSGARAAVAVGFGPTGDLWISTARGLYHNGAGGDWERFELPKEAGARFTALALHGDTLYAGTDRGLIARRADAWEYLGPSESTPEGAVRAFTSAAGKLWIGTSDLARIENAAGGLKTAIESKESEQIPSGSEKDAPKPKLAGSEGGKLPSPGSARAVPLPVRFPARSEPGLFVQEGGALSSYPLDNFSGGVLALNATPEGKLWIAGRSGLRLLGPGGSAERFTETETIGARSVAVDARGGRWFAATDAPTGRGLGLLVRTATNWTSITQQDGLPANEVYSVAAQGDTIWIAQPKGIASVTETGVTTTKLPGPIFAITSTPKGIWAAGCNELYHQEDGAWATYPKPPGSHAAVLATDSQGRLYAGNETGLYRLDGKTWIYLPGAGGLSLSALAITTENRAELLWAGAENGAVVSFVLP